MSDFQPTNAQGAVLDVLIRLVGFTGVNRRPEQDGDVILDLLPGEHVMFDGDPFCVRITPDGVMVRITDEEAGLTERPEPLEALRLRNAAMTERILEAERDRS